jgi:hypothetical protein
VFPVRYALDLYTRIWVKAFRQFTVAASSSHLRRMDGNSFPVLLEKTLKTLTELSHIRVHWTFLSSHFL